MRTTLIALATLAVCGCAGSGATRPPVAKIHETPVARSMPSPASRRIEHRLRAGQEVTGKTAVEGRLVR